MQLGVLRPRMARGRGHEQWDAQRARPGAQDRAGTDGRLDGARAPAGGGLTDANDAGPEPTGLVAQPRWRAYSWRRCLS